LAELYLLFKYLRPAKMRELGINTFDKWASTFADQATELEFSGGRWKEISRFRRFANVPGLLSLYREIADVRNRTNLVLPRPEAKHHLVVISPTEAQNEFMKMLLRFIDTKGKVHREVLGLSNGWDEDKDRNPAYAIMATTFGKRLALDTRVISRTAAPGAKISRAADTIYEEYVKSNHYKGTQLVFCDLATPKSQNTVVNLYDYFQNLDTFTETDLNEVFGDDFQNKESKPSLSDIKERMRKVLELTDQEIDGMIQEANTSEPFNAYDDLKHELIKRGIPAEEIEFIHNHEGDVKRQALYNNLNEGNVRVALGSTKKMGTGVNVQKRVIAMHHLDIQWRPSDMEQRNGRGERQGNEMAELHKNNTVDIYYYATERLMDAEMYSVVGQKAAMIESLKSAGADVYEIEDLESQPDISLFAATLSGDPLFKEREETRKRVDYLRKSLAAFRDSRYETEKRLRHAKIIIDAKKETIDELKKALKYVEKIPKTEDDEYIFQAEIDGETYDKVGEAGAAVVKFNMEALLSKPYEKDFKIGTIWGFTIVGQITKVRQGKEIIRKIISPDGTLIGAEAVFSINDVSAGIQIKQPITEIAKNIRQAEESIATQTANIPKYEEQLKGDFPHMAELEQKQARMKEIEDEFRKREEEERRRESAAGQEYDKEDDEDGDLPEDDDDIRENRMADMTALINRATSKKPVVDAKEAEKLLKHLSQKYGIEGVLADLGAFGSHGQFSRRDMKVRINRLSTLDKDGQYSAEITGNINRRTIFHEYLHPFVELLRDANPELFNQLAGQAAAAVADDLSNYAASKREEEVVVRYLDQLSDQDQPPSAWKRFWNAISEFFFGKRKNDRATLEQLSKDTTVEELYKIFQNYGNLKADAAPVIDRNRLSDEIAITKVLLETTTDDNVRLALERILEEQEASLISHDQSAPNKEQRIKNALLTMAFNSILDGISKEDFLNDTVTAFTGRYGGTTEEKSNIRKAYEQAEQLLAEIDAAVNDPAAIDAIIDRVSFGPLADDIRRYAAQNKGQGAAEEETQPEDEGAEESSQNAPGSDFLDDFQLTTASNKIQQLQSGRTLEEVYGEMPEGDQSYHVNELAGMITDGEAMIGKAKAVYQTDDIAGWGPKFLNYLKTARWENAAKKTIALGRLIHHIKEGKLNGRPDLNRLEQQALTYWQELMRSASLSLNSGRLLRLLRDEELADFYIDRILNENEVKAKRGIVENEGSVIVTDDIAEKGSKTTEEDVAELVEKTKRHAKEEKKKANTKKYAEKAKEKKSELENSDLIDKIKNFLNNLKC
jgi:hypothetical protein